MKIKVYYSDKLCLIFQKRSPRTLLTNSANSAKEITINKKSADQLHINTPQEQLDFILQSSTEYALIGAYTDGQIFLWNEGAQCIYGHPPEEAVGKANISLLFTKDDLTKLNEVIDIILRGNKWEGTLTQQRKNGEKFSARLIITPQLNQKNGQISGILIISNDITNEIRLAKELNTNHTYPQTLEEKFHSLLEAVPDATMIVDEHGKILLVNTQTEKLFGYDRNTLAGKPVETLVPKRFQNIHPRLRQRFAI